MSAESRVRASSASKRLLLGLLATMCLGLALPQLASAAVSSNVLFVPNTEGYSDDGGGDNGGQLPTSGFRGGFTINSGSTSATSIATNPINPTTGFDTVVLVQQCNIGTFLSQPTFKSRIENFVANGGKLIIWDSECEGTDYSNFVLPFESNQPGSGGISCDDEEFDAGTCVLRVVEDNTLSSENASSAAFVDVRKIAIETDAVGDANVFTSQNANWCIDMAARNGNAVLGPVQAYARHGSGLIIYNGLDMDDIDEEPIDNSTGSGALGVVFEQNLKQTFNPDSLPCGVRATGITLSPPAQTFEVNQSATVTATVRDQLGGPVAGIVVSFEAISGPNAGKTGSGTTDANGNATLTYTSSAPGVDTWRASYVEPTPPEVVLTRAGDIHTSNDVTVTWTVPVVIPVQTAVAPPPIAIDSVKPTVTVSAIRSCVKSSVRVAATAADDVAVSKVEFYLDGKLVRTDRKARYTATISVRKLKAGRHRLRVVVTDTSGNASSTTKRFSKCAKPAATIRRVSPRFTG